SYVDTERTARLSHSRWYRYRGSVSGNLCTNVNKSTLTPHLRKPATRVSGSASASYFSRSRRATRISRPAILMSTPLIFIDDCIGEFGSISISIGQAILKGNGAFSCFHAYPQDRDPTTDAAVVPCSAIRGREIWEKIASMIRATRMISS